MRQEASIRRALRDTRIVQQTIPFMWAGQGVLAVAGGAWFTALASANASTVEQVARAVGGGLIGLGIAVVCIFAFNFVMTPYRQRDEAWAEIDRFTSLTSEKWYFRIGGLDFYRRALESPEHTVAIDLMITNKLPHEHASISHFVLEASNSDGVIRHLDPRPRRDIGAPSFNDRPELVTPIYFKPKETIVGQISFLVPDLGRVGTYGTPALYIRDEAGTEYRLALHPNTIFRIASASRKEDYPRGGAS